MHFKLVVHVQVRSSNTSECTAYSFFCAVAHELEQLFIKQSSLEVYFEWLDSIIEKRVSEVRIIITISSHCHTVYTVHILISP